ncbi:MAG: helix-turn-helix domain-containing protein [Clostridia bacterium]|nr:helix-turn-helix domain-containing protein [Clostridia bacterium]
MDMEQATWKSGSADALLAEFFAHDDLKALAADAGALLECPLLVLDDTFHVTAHHRPLGFTDPFFQDAVRQGEITYEAGAIISQSEALSAGRADYVKLEGSDYRRRFSPLISSGVRLGYLICVDTDGHLQNIPPETWNMVEQILAKQAFIEVSRQDKPFETTEDILMHLLDGGFSSAPYFRLQASGTYLADFHPTGFALIELTTYHNEYLGKRHLKDELGVIFPQSHSFLYRGDVFLFLHGNADFNGFSALAEEFQLKIVMSDGINDLFNLPALYRTAHEALELMTDRRFHSGNVCTVAQLRTPLLLKKLEGRSDLIAKEIRVLAAHDKEKDTQYCETLYYYLTCCRSLKKTCDALFTHRNTVLNRIRRIKDDFAIPLDEPAIHADLLLGVSLLLFEKKGPDFFLHAINKTEREEQ